MKKIINDLINDVLSYAELKQKQLEVVQRYLRIHYKCNIDLFTLKKRLKNNNDKSKN
jgi:hypothetical protein